MFFLRFTGANITRWDIYLLFEMQGIVKAAVEVFHDMIINMLSPTALDIRELVFRLPCLCSPVYLRNTNRKGRYEATPALWTSTFPSALQRFPSRLRVRKGVVQFLFQRQKGLPPCPLRRCLALAGQLEEVKRRMEGDDVPEPVERSVEGRLVAGCGDFNTGSSWPWIT